MDEFLESKTEVRSWTARIAEAVRQQEIRGIVSLIKPAALVAAASGRMDLIERWLRHVPPALVKRDPQLLYWSGASIAMQRPAEALPLMQRAFDIFSRRPDGNWTLLAWAGIVDAIFLLYRDLRELDPWIEWMTPEREQIVDLMPTPQQSLVVGSALFALAFRQPNHPRMAVWRDRAERLVELNPVSNLGTRLTAGLINDYTWRGNLAAAEVARMRFCARASRTRLSPLATVLSHLNDATLYLHQGQLVGCLNSVDAGLKASSSHNIRIWDGIFRCHAISAACSQEDIHEARRHIAAVEQQLEENIPLDEAYFRGVLYWSAHVAGDHVGVVSRCENALALTDAKGAPYFQAVCRIGTAMALFEAGHRERGLHLLDEGLQMGREIDNPLLQWIGGLFQSHMAYVRGDSTGGDAALENAMRLGRDHSLAHFFCWPRRIIARLIDHALERDYSTDYARFLIKTHAFLPGNLPTCSDQWQFEVRIYTFGNARIEHADGRIESLSVQFLRQIELLVALIGMEGKPTPVHALATDVYQHDDVDAIGSIKRVLHSLRGRIGKVITQRNTSLELDFTKVWIDACSFQQLRHLSCNAPDIEAWLAKYYQGHFMDGVENSEIVLGIRRRLHDQAERALREVYLLRVRAGDLDALSHFEERWKKLFPLLFMI